MRKGKAATWMLVAIAGLGGLEVALAQEVSRTGKSPSPVRAQSTTIEAESLVAAAVVNGGTVSAQAMGGFGTGWSGGAQLFWDIGTPGAVLDLNIDIPASAEYAVELYFTKAPDYGQVRIEIAGKPSSVVFDGYAPRVMVPIPTQAGRFALEAGQYNFSFQATGKNSQSGGYRIGIDQIRLYPVGALSGQTINAEKNVQTAQSAVQVPAPSSNEAKPNPGGVGPPPPPQAPHAEVIKNSRDTIQTPATLPVTEPKASATPASLTLSPSVPLMVNEPKPMKDDLILQPIFVPSLCDSIPKSVDAILQMTEEAREALKGVGMSGMITVSTDELQTYFVGSVQNKCCSPNKSFSVQDQQEAGCIGSDTVAQCMDKLTKNCIRKQVKSFQIEEKMQRGSDFITLGEKFKQLGQRMQYLQGLLP